MSPAVTSFDVLVLTDLRFPGGSSTSLLEELVAARAGSYSVGVLHFASPRLGSSGLAHAGLRQALDDGVAHLVLPGEAVRARLTIVKHPMVFAVPLGAVLPVDTDQVIVTVGQVPADSSAVYYDPTEVDANIMASLGIRATWAPVSATVRATLDGVQLADHDWTEIIDVDEWRRPRLAHHPPSPPSPAAAPAADAAEPFDPLPRVDDRLVIGRHSRPDRLKWPDNADDLRAAYPIDGSVRVRVLGGADAAAAVLGTMPEGWEIAPFGSLDPREFLAGLDAFVYFHHPDLIEAFGRSILEALAVGIPVVVPAHFRSTFGDACIYAEPRHALDRLRALLEDPAERSAHAERADRIVRSRFSYQAHFLRLRDLIGAPSSMSFVDETPSVPSLDLAPPGLRSAYTRTLVACLGATLDEAEATIHALDRHRRRAPGFIPVVVVNITRPLLAAELGIETAVISSPARWDDTAEPWVSYAQRRLRQLAAHHKVDNIVPFDIHSEYAWIALQLERSAR